MSEATKEKELTAKELPVEEKELPAEEKDKKKRPLTYDSLVDEDSGKFQRPQPCADDEHVVGSMYRALSDTHPWECIKCGKAFVGKEVRNLKSVGVNYALVEAALDDIERKSTQ